MNGEDSHSRGGRADVGGRITGPEPLRPEFRNSLFELLNGVFYPDSGRDMAGDFPFFLREENFPNLLICRDGDRVVSHVGLLEKEVSYFGHRLKVGMIGAVATHPDYRGRGLATGALFEAFDRFRRRGGHLVMISGRRDLYYRNGARRVGAFSRYAVDPSRCRDRHDDLRAERAGRDRAGLFARLHRLKPLRFIRPLEEWELHLEAEFCRGRPSEFWLGFRDGAPAAYVIFREEVQDGRRVCCVTEWGGRPRDAFRILVERADREGFDEVQWSVYPHEQQMEAVLQDAGARHTGAHTAYGTQRIIDFPALMEALRDYFAEIVGRETADRLTFREREAGFFRIGLEEQTLAIEGRGTLAEVLFGAGPEVLADPRPGGQLFRTLSELLPLTALNYDVSHA